MNSLSGSVSKRNRKSIHHGFGCKWEDYDKVMYEGMESAYYLKASPPAGTYRARIVNDKEVNPMRYSCPKGLRGILEEPSKLAISKLTPNPGAYNLKEKMEKIKNKAPRFSMP